MIPPSFLAVALLLVPATLLADAGSAPARIQGRHYPHSEKNCPPRPPSMVTFADTDRGSVLHNGACGINNVVGGTSYLTSNLAKGEPAATPSITPDQKKKYPPVGSNVLYCKQLQGEALPSTWTSICYQWSSTVARSTTTWADSRQQLTNPWAGPFASNRRSESRQGQGSGCCSGGRWVSEMRRMSQWPQP